MAPTILDDRSDESEIRRSRNRIVKQHRHSSVINYGESFEWKLSTRSSQNKVHWHVNWVRVLFVCNLLDSFHSLFERTRFATCDKCHSLTQRALIDKTELKQNGKSAHALNAQVAMDWCCCCCCCWRHQAQTIDSCIFLTTFWCAQEIRARKSVSESMTCDWWAWQNENFLFLFFFFVFISSARFAIAFFFIRF